MRNYFQKIGLILGGLCLLMAPAPFALADSPGSDQLHIPLNRPGLTAEIRSIQFYGSPYYGPVDYHKRKSLYQKSFAAADTKYINWELVLDHPGPRQETKKFLIAATVYDANDRLVKKGETLAWIEPDMTWSQWGGTFDAAAWDPGIYQVIISIGGREHKKEYVRTSFEVVGERNDFQKLRARVVSLRFFEDDANTQPESARVYNNRFAQSKTRYIHWELKLDYPPPGKLVPFTVNAIYYTQEGKVLSDLNSKRTIQSDWDNSWHCGGFGSATPGSWRPGVYQLVLKINGKETVRGSFQVVADQAAAGPPPGPTLLDDLGAKILSIKLFEGPFRLPANFPKNFRQTFERDETRVIYLQLEFAMLYLPNPPSKTFTQTADILFFDSQGRLFKEIGAEPIEIGLMTKPFIIGYGWETPGKWPADTYQVVIKIQGRELGRSSFRVD